MKKSSKSILICLLLLLINIVMLLHYSSKMPIQPPEDFNHQIDEIFNNDEVRIVDGNANDITSEFKVVFQNAYDNKEYEAIYEACLASNLSFDYGIE